MKLAFGLYRHMLNEEHYRFARQCGATHVIIHLVDYFSHQDNNKENSNQPIGGKEGWGSTGNSEVWRVEDLVAIKRELKSYDLELAGIENIDPALWHDVLLAGPKRDEQIERVKELIRNMGSAEIPVLGYNFSLAGVSSRIEGPFARGGAISVGMDGRVDNAPIPFGTVWNMTFDQSAPEGFYPCITHKELWERLEYFLRAVVPVAEQSGVVLAAHPDDPPMPFVRNSPRLVYQPEMYQRLIDLYPSENSKLEYCLGSISEMTNGDIYEMTDSYSKQNKIAYIHFRNVVGKVPNYREVFIDEGDIDMFKILEILKRNNFEGVLIPDHTPQMSSPGPWYSGMAYAMGYMQAAMKVVNS